MNRPDLTALTRATAGLLMPSESDEPITVVHWDDAASELDNAAILRLAGCEPGKKVERIDPTDLLRDALHGSEASRFRELLQTLETAVDAVRGYRIGEVEKDVYLMGRLKDGSGWAGVRSLVVET